VNREYRPIQWVLVGVFSPSSQTWRRVAWTNNWSRVVGRRKECSRCQGWGWVPAADFWKWFKAVCKCERVDYDDWQAICLAAGVKGRLAFYSALAKALGVGQ